MSASPALLNHRLDGDGEPVLLLNGGMMTIAAWGEIASRIAERFRVVRCDFRGQLTTPGPSHAELSGHVGDLVALLDHLGLDKVHVLGASFGAEVGLLLAATAPQRVASIIAVTATDVFTESFLEGSARMRRIIEDVLAGGDRGPFHDAMVEDIYSERYIEANRDVLAARRAQMSLFPEAWFRDLDTLLSCTEKVDLRPHLGRVSAPGLVVIADGDKVMPPARSRALAEAIGAEVRELQGSGHALVVENPQWLTDTCLAFLERQSFQEVSRPTRREES